MQGAPQAAPVQPVSDSAIKAAVKAVFLNEMAEDVSVEVEVVQPPGPLGKPTCMSADADAYYALDPQ